MSKAFFLLSNDKKGCCTFLRCSSLFLSALYVFYQLLKPPIHPSDFLSHSCKVRRTAPGPAVREIKALTAFSARFASYRSTPKIAALRRMGASTASAWAVSRGRPEGRADRICCKETSCGSGLGRNAWPLSSLPSFFQSSFSTITRQRMSPTSTNGGGTSKQAGAYLPPR